MGIDVTTGDLSLERIDLAMAGPIPILMRRYWSTYAVTGEPSVFGAGWRSSFDYGLRQTLSGWVYSTPRGTELPIHEEPGELDRDGRVCSPAHGIELQRRGPDELAVISFGRDREPVELRFARVGGGWQLSAAHRQPGVRVEYRWHRGRIVGIWQTRNQRGVSFEYDGHGRLRSAITATGTGAPLGPRVDYEYDEAGRLVGVRDRAGVLMRYEYGERGYLRSELRRDGQIWEYAYDRRGRCVRASEAGGRNERTLVYDSDALVTEQRDSHGAVTTFTYDGDGRVISETSATGATALFGYDELGRINFRQLPDGLTVKSIYDDRGRLVRLVYPGDKPQEFEFDDQHWAIAYRDWRGNTTKFERDGHGNVTGCDLPIGQRWSVDYNDFGEPERIVAPDGGETRYGWDAVGRVVARRDPSGGTWRFQYDALGLMTAEVDPLGDVTQHQYDDRQRLRASTYADGSSVTRSYDDGDTVVRERRSDGAERWMRVNACGEALALSDYSGRVQHYEWDTEQGRLLSLRGPDGVVHEFRYDADGRPIRHAREHGEVIEFEWSGGQLRARTDALGRRWEYSYDDLGFLTRLEADDETWIEFEIDPVHADVAAITTPDSEIRYERDACGRIVAELHGERRIERSVDAGGRRLSLRTSEDDEIRWAYTTKGTCRSVAVGELVVASELDELEREVLRDYAIAGTSVGSLTQSFDPMGRLLAQRYAPAAAPDAGFERRFRYDGGGMLSTIQDSLRGWTRYIHGRTGKLLLSDPERGPSRFEGYDLSENRVWEARISDEHATAEAFARHGNEFDEHWRELPREVERRGGEVVRFVHDEADRVLEARYPDRFLQYRWDAGGQLIEKTVRRTLGGDPVQRWRFEWDGFGRLVAVEDLEAQRWTYAYDGLGRRIRKTGPEGVVEYLWNGDELLYRFADGGKRMYVYRGDPADLVAVIDDDELRLVVCDQVGAPSELLDREGRLREALERSTWGALRNPDELDAGFRNQWRDPETELFYSRHRYYDPDIGRFISPDPLRLRAGLNYYRYAPSPVEFSDPTGLMALLHRYQGPVYMADQVTMGTRSHSTSGGTPHLVGTDTVTTTRGTQQIGLSSNTAADVYVGDTHVFTGYNGYMSGRRDGSRRVALRTEGVSSTTWYHAEMNAMRYGIENPHVFEGLDGHITVHISRPPCHKHRGTGCDVAIHGLAQHLSDATGRRVVVEYPNMDADYVDYFEFRPRRQGGC